MEIIKKKDQKVNDNNFKQNRVIALVLEPKERTLIWEPHQELIIKSYDKIGEIWNRDQKGRNFIKHLIASFLPLNQFARIMSFGETEHGKCAILGDELYGIVEIAKSMSEIGMKKIMIESKAISEHREKHNQEEIDELNELRNSKPKNLLDGRVAYFSESSDKYLSQEANIALYYFAQNMLFESDELRFTIKKKQINSLNTKTKLTKSETNKVVKAQAYGSKISENIKSDVLEKLQAMKNELEEK